MGTVDGKNVKSVQFVVKSVVKIKNKNGFFHTLFHTRRGISFAARAHSTLRDDGRQVNKYSCDEAVTRDRCKKPLLYRGNNSERVFNSQWREIYFRCITPSCYFISSQVKRWNKFKIEFVLIKLFHLFICFQF